MIINIGDRFRATWNDEWIEVLFIEVNSPKSKVSDMIEYSYDYDRGTKVESNYCTYDDFIENIESGNFIPAQEYRKNKINNILNGEKQ